MISTERPLLLVDVDGVLNPFAARSCPKGFTQRTIAGYPVRLNPEHGLWLNELAGAGFELVWATTWEDQADSLIAPHLGLPRGMPVIHFPYGETYSGWTWKLPAIRSFIGQRPTAWIDDDLGRDATRWASERAAAGISTLLLKPNPGTGMVRAHIDRLARWATDLSTRP